ncbi:MAG: hypothetical protein FD180_1800 [Planctomycetota bacterium]|nr:MAG: hypothetical protein FD180_1800 [Planctomycetota bacterium]
MRFPAIVLAFVVAALPVLADPPTEQDVRGWIAQLSDDDSVKRDEAQRRIESLDIAWKKTLQDSLAASTDAEARARLTEILAKIGRIQWITDVTAAVAKARAEKKPLLVMATPGAPDSFS